LTAALYQCDVPYFSVVLRKVFGVAGAAFVDNRIPNMRVAWPSGDWGSLPLEGGIYVSTNLILIIYIYIYIPTMCY
jgi:acetyl-CoA carboxylase carboxyltransferase component